MTQFANYSNEMYVYVSKASSREDSSKTNPDVGMVGNRHGTERERMKVDKK